MSDRIRRWAEGFGIDMRGYAEVPPGIVALYLRETGVQGAPTPVPRQGRKRSPVQASAPRNEPASVVQLPPSAPARVIRQWWRDNWQILNLNPPKDAGQIPHQVMEMWQSSAVVAGAAVKAAADADTMHMNGRKAKLT